jgi:predicted  nucleic acid-binding Zn-ribbon protein
MKKKEEIDKFIYDINDNLRDNNHKNKLVGTLTALFVQTKSLSYELDKVNDENELLRNANKIDAIQIKSQQERIKGLEEALGVARAMLGSKYHESNTDIKRMDEILTNKQR